MVTPTSDDHNADPNDPRNTHTSRAANRPGQAQWRKAIILVLALGILAFAVGYYGWSNKATESTFISIPEHGRAGAAPDMRVSL